MWRVATSVILIVAQAAALVAAPLHVCTSARGERSLDFGPALCVACQPKPGCGHAHESSAPSSEQGLAPTPRPCDCDHQPLGDESQIASRATWLDWSLDACSVAVDAVIAPPMAFNANAPGLLDSAGVNTALRDRASVVLRC